MITVVLVAMAVAAPTADATFSPAIYHPIPGCDTTVFVDRPDEVDPSMPGAVEPPACITEAAERRRERLQCGAGVATTCFAATRSRPGAP